MKCKQSALLVLCWTLDCTVISFTVVSSNSLQRADFCLKFLFEIFRVRFCEIPQKNFRQLVSSKNAPPLINYYVKQAENSSWNWLFFGSRFFILPTSLLSLSFSLSLSLSPSRSVEQCWKALFSVLGAGKVILIFGLLHFVLLPLASSLGLSLAPLDFFLWISFVHIGHLLFRRTLADHFLGPKECVLASFVNARQKSAEFRWKIQN